jgi:nucleotide-binding universal stress UspA family protein
MSIVVGYIPSPLGEAALAAGVQEARRRQTGLVVVNSSQGHALVDPRFAVPEQVAELEQRLASEGVDVTVVQSATGREAADEILAAADDHDAELVVIGVRHRTAVGKLLLGSTAQKVVLEARTPVLAVKV